MNVKLLTKHHWEFLSLIGDCTGSSEPIHVKMPHCWKSHVAAQLSEFNCLITLYLNVFKKKDKILDYRPFSQSLISIIQELSNITRLLPVFVADQAGISMTRSQNTN